jgi:hypothetical protein
LYGGYLPMIFNEVLFESEFIMFYKWRDGPPQTLMDYFAEINGWVLSTFSSKI